MEDEPGRSMTCSFNANAMRLDRLLELFAFGWRGAAWKHVRGAYSIRAILERSGSLHLLVVHSDFNQRKIPDVLPVIKQQRHW
ncbi:hypothetical protein PPTG_22873 [Phytophthora nicotianae INRA-310]|uniref:Uncharacterized protein n=1 Tax=Phytophthora nicotianae (strain INRA-310) TaxID=761204 RepID=W2Q944_PHYN3|nr:hypothetical protein PPTG_22873 [Phytophthora nicotianae INRA-310]ETN09381.1 hypothetical protein PPTG_22873 [Phytophthora nicotianae INRA-310]